MIEEFDFETPSIGRFNKNITITPKNISFTNKSCIRLDKNFEPSIRIDGGLSQLFMYANFHIYVLSDDGLVTMKTEIKTDNFLNLVYDTFEEDGNYFYFYFKQNTGIFRDNFAESSVTNAYTTLTLLLSGKFNEIQKVKYGELPKVIMDIMKNNSIKGHSAVSYEILLSELCVNRKNPTESFRKIAKTDSDSNEFAMLNIRDIPRNVSSFNAISSENILKGLTSSILNTKLGTTPQLTPMEEVSLNKY